VRDLFVSFLAAFLVGLGSLKLAGAERLMATPWGRRALAVGLAEVALGAWAWLRPHSVFAWGAILCFTAALVAHSVFGPALPRCACLGLDAHLDPPQRLALALALFAGTALATSMVLNAPERRSRTP